MHFSLRPILWEGYHVNSKDPDGDTPLICAAHNEHTATAELLLGKGADIAAANKEGTTALMWARKNKHEKIAQYL